MKITLWKELGHLVQRYRAAILKINPMMLSNTFSDFISDMRVLITNTMIDNIKNKIENLHLQECSLKNKPFWKLVILLEASFF